MSPHAWYPNLSTPKRAFDKARAHIKAQSKPQDQVYRPSPRHLFVTAPRWRARIRMAAATLCGLALVAGVVIGAANIILFIDRFDSALESAHWQGMQQGLLSCPSPSARAKK